MFIKRRVEESDSSRRRRPSAALLVAVAGVSMLLGSFAYAAIPSAGGEYRACYAKSSGILLGIPYTKGELRMVDEGEACRSYEKPATWNEQGVPGTNGTNGTNGIDGAAGANGVSGYQVVQQVQETQSDYYFDMTLNCPFGKRALGGGWKFQLVEIGTGLAQPMPAERVFQDSPSDGGLFWHVKLEAEAYPADGHFYRLSVYAICATVG